MNGIAVAALSLVAALIVTPMAMVAARRTGIVDRPGVLKTQTTPVPYLGGIGVFVGTAVGALAGRPAVLVPLAAALALGVCDDRFDLPALPRLAGEVGIGVAVMVTGGRHLPGALAAVVVVVTVLLINGVNLLDGLDMLAAGVTAVAAAGFAMLLHGDSRLLGLALAGSLLGFLAYNRPPARIYLGDGGSYLLGTALALLCAAAWAPHVPGAVGLAAMALVAIPAAEVAFAVIRRARGRQSLLAGDRGHPYDRLVHRGWAPPAASLAYIGVQAVFTVAAVVVGRRSLLVAALAVDLVCAALLVALAGATGALTPDREAQS